MSYILDALRRADAERERGGVPGLHTQAMPDVGDDERPARRTGLRPWHWVVIGLAGGLAAAVAWQWSGGSGETAPPPPLPPPPIARATEPEPAPPPAEPRPAASPPPLAAAPAAAPAVAPAIAPMRATPAAASPSASVVAAAPASAPMPTSAEPQRIASLAALPADLRAGLPPLSFGGSIYSNTPANRLLIVNGQLMHEGESLGPGVTLEQIKPKAAVISIRGQRFEVGL